LGLLVRKLLSRNRLHKTMMTRIHRIISSLLFMGVKHGVCGPGSSVGIATDYGLDGPGIESRWGRDFSHTSRPTLGPTRPPVQWVPGLSWGVKRPGCGADHPPLLAPKSRKSRAIPLPPSGPSGLLRGTFTFTFDPEDIKILSLGAIRNLGQRTGLS
jgi:hypothetical protein